MYIKCRELISVFTTRLMFDFLIEILELNIDYRSILTYIIIYIFSLWLLFAVWVYFDASKRYENVMVPLLLSIIVFILNFPALIFYLIIRPEDEDDYVFIHHPDGDHVASTGVTHGGVAVPLAQFTNENGDSVLTFQVTINKEAINPHMAVDITTSDKLETVTIPSETGKPVEISTPKAGEKVEKKAKSFFSKIGSQFGSIKDSILSYSKELEKHESNNVKTKNVDKKEGKESVEKKIDEEVIEKKEPEKKQEQENKQNKASKAKRKKRKAKRRKK